MGNNYLSVTGNNNTIFQGNRIHVCGRELPLPHGCSKDNIRLTATGGKIYVNGYQWFPEQGVWKRTGKALWYDFAK